LLLRLIKNYFISFRNQPLDIQIAFVLFLAGAFCTLCLMLTYFFTSKMDLTQAISGMIICSLSAYALLYLAEHLEGSHISLQGKLFLSFVFGFITIAVVMPLLSFLLRGIFYN
jgi:hypothetical protein